MLELLEGEGVKITLKSLFCPWIQVTLPDRIPAFPYVILKVLQRFLHTKKLTGCVDQNNPKRMAGNC